MSTPVGLNCPNCGKDILVTYDVTQDKETTCPQCESVIVLPRNGEKPPFVKSSVKK
jgi:DNA-directed RNA polymerase subunit RPC12/RpoP